MVTAKEAGIKTPYDLKGKRVFWIPGAPAHNITNTAFLAFANLTWNDVKKVEYPSYAAAARGMVEGTCDAGFNTGTHPSSLRTGNIPARDLVAGIFPFR